MTRLVLTYVVGAVQGLCVAWRWHPWVWTGVASAWMLYCSLAHARTITVRVRP